MPEAARSFRSAREHARLHGLNSTGSKPPGSESARPRRLVLQATLRRVLGRLGAGVLPRQSGFWNFSVIRSLSPIASYLAWSKAGLAGWPGAALRRVGGRVQTPNG